MFFSRFIRQSGEFGRKLVADSWWFSVIADNVSANSECGFKKNVQDV